MDPELMLILASIGVVAGLIMLVRGFRAQTTALRVADTATSRVASLAAGEVRIMGTVEPAEVTIVSPLQSATCVWYRARISGAERDHDGEIWRDERGIGFRVNDGTGSIRVFPRDARIDVGDRFDESDGFALDRPPGLQAQPHVAAEAAGSGRLRYREARLEPGDVVTVIGSAVPFLDLGDPVASDLMTPAGVGADDPEVAADIRRARAAGLLVEPDEAWGNAAIAGFGIGRPVSEPELHPDAARLELATPEEVSAIERTWDLTPDQLVLASVGGGLLIAAGSPGDVAERHRDRYIVGLLGAALAIGSAMAAAWALANQAAT